MLERDAGGEAKLACSPSFIIVLKISKYEINGTGEVLPVDIKKIKTKFH
jgi:hypothetical protein